MPEIDLNARPARTHWTVTVFALIGIVTLCYGVRALAFESRNSAAAALATQFHAFGQAAIIAGAIFVVGAGLISAVRHRDS